MTAFDPPARASGGAPASLRIEGPPRSGKTRRLVARAAELSRDGVGVTVVCADRRRALRFEAALLRARGDVEHPPELTRSPSSQGGRGLDSVLARVGSGDPVVTTLVGLAMDVLGRRGQDLQLIGRAVCVPVLEALRDDDWPVDTDALLWAIDRLTLTPCTDDEIRARAGASAERWVALTELAQRYRSALAQRGVTDAAGAIASAVSALREGEASPAGQTLGCTVIDDAHELDPAAYGLLAARPPFFVVAAASAAADTGMPRNAETPGDAADPWWRRLPVRDCELLPAAAPKGLRLRLGPAHPALEGELVARRLLAGRDAGLRWCDMAVVAHDAVAASNVARSCTRLGIPARGGAFAARVDHPAVAAALDAPPDAATAAVAGSLVGDYLDDAAVLGLLREMAADPGPARVWAERYTRRGPRWEGADDVGALGLDAVTIAAPHAVAGSGWPLLVLTGAVEGTWPRLREPTPFFDPAVLEGGGRSEPHERRAALIGKQRQQFADLCARGDEVCAVVTPEAGVLISRFVEDWPEFEQPFVAPVPPTRFAMQTTVCESPVWADPRLRLSATQIAAYENCPLSFAFQYAVGARSEGGVQARVGTVTHAIFEEFLRPGAGEHALARLLQIADDRWDPTIFDYRPQNADYRRRLDEWLQRWWEDEGSSLDPARVVAVEHHFTVPVGPHVLTGFIDRVDRVDTPAGPRLEVVDYKTGSAPPGTSDDENLQLAVYHLAAVRDPELAALGRPHRLRLHYLSHGKNVEQAIAPDHEERTAARIQAAADAMLAEEFAPSAAADCEYCEFARLCPLQPLGRQVGT